MNKSIWFIAGLAAGAAGGILLAPQTGRHSRAFIRDKTVKYSHDVSDFAGKKSRHVANKARGYAHVAKDFVSEKIVRREAPAIKEALGI
jgi:gas vesicle protein